MKQTLLLIEDCLTESMLIGKEKNHITKKVVCLLLQYFLTTMYSKRGCVQKRVIADCIQMLDCAVNHCQCHPVLAVLRLQLEM